MEPPATESIFSHPKDALVLEFRKDHSWGYVTLTHEEILRKGQEKCQQLFQSTAGTLRHRDIRLLIPDSSISSAIILVRKLSFIVNLNFVRSLVLWDRMFVFFPAGADEFISLVRSKFKNFSAHGSFESSISLFRENSATTVSKDSNPKLVPAEDENIDLDFEENATVSENLEDDIEAFELIALEVVFWTALKVVEMEYHRLEPTANVAMRRAKKEHNTSCLDALGKCREAAESCLE
jgi:hypothetical protein